MSDCCKYRPGDCRVNFCFNNIYLDVKVKAFMLFAQESEMSAISRMNNIIIYINGTLTI